MGEACRDGQGRGEVRVVERMAERGGREGGCRWEMAARMEVRVTV